MLFYFAIAYSCLRLPVNYKKTGCTKIDQPV